MKDAVEGGTANNVPERGGKLALANFEQGREIARADRVDTAKVGVESPPCVG